MAALVNIPNKSLHFLNAVAKQVCTLVQILTYCIPIKIIMPLFIKILYCSYSLELRTLTAKGKQCTVLCILKPHLRQWSEHVTQMFLIFFINIAAITKSIYYQNFSLFSSRLFLQRLYSYSLYIHPCNYHHAHCYFHESHNLYHVHHYPTYDHPPHPHCHRPRS